VAAEHIEHTLIAFKGSFSIPQALGSVCLRLGIVRGISVLLERSERCELLALVNSCKGENRPYCIFFCVQSRSRWTSFAAFMPSAKLALVFESRALACACKAANSRFFAFSSPDLIACQS
jgi:hypothetical protein